MGGEHKAVSRLHGIHKKKSMDPCKIRSLKIMYETRCKLDFSARKVYSKSCQKKENKQTGEPDGSG